MPEIKKEYPEGKRSLEMVLVEMLAEHRSWDDYKKISQALWRIRFRAKGMEKERDIVCSDSGPSEAPSKSSLFHQYLDI